MSISLESLKIKPSIKAALIENGGELAPIYNIILAFECGDWNTLESLGITLNISMKEVNNYYLASIEWANALLKTTAI